MFEIRVEPFGAADYAEQEDRRRRLSFGLSQRQQPIRGKIVGVNGYLYDVLVPGRDHPYSDVPPCEPVKLRLGAVVWLGFVEDNQGIPFIMAYSRGTNPRVLTGSRSIPDFFAAWFRLSIRAAYRWFAQAWDDPEEPSSSIVFSPSALPPIVANRPIVRTDAEGVLYWSSGSHLLTRDLTSGASTDLELGAPIVALSLGEYSGRSYAVVQAGYSPPTEGGYSEGYDAGVALVDDAPWEPEGQGYSDCTTEAGYQLEPALLFYLDSNPPTEPGEEYASGWNDGITARYTELYNQGYESGGCTV